MRTREIEARIFELEEIVVVIRAPANLELGDYNFQRKAAGNTSVTEWIDARLAPAINGCEFRIVGGNFTAPHGRTRLDTLRAGYEA